MSRPSALLVSSPQTAFCSFVRKRPKSAHSVAAPLPTKSNDFVGALLSRSRDSRGTARGRSPCVTSLQWRRAGPADQTAAPTGRHSPFADASARPGTGRRSPIDNDTKKLAEKERKAFRKITQVLSMMLLAFYFVLRVTVPLNYTGSLGVGILLAASFQYPCIMGRLTIMQKMGKK